MGTNLRRQTDSYSGHPSQVLLVGRLFDRFPFSLEPIVLGMPIFSATLEIPVIGPEGNLVMQ